MSDSQRSKATVLQITRFVNLLLAGLLAGLLVGVLMVEAALVDLPATTYTAVQQPKHEIFEPIAAAYVAVVVTGMTILVLTFRQFRSVAFVLTLVAVFCIVISIIATLTVNVPINTEIMNTWSAQSPPADWAEIRHRWNAAHLIRTILMVAAFICVLAAASTSSVKQVPNDDART